MKSSINIILPIALAIILPGLSLFSNSGRVVVGSLGFFGGWLMISAIVYLLWYVLWFLWDVKSKYKVLLFLLAIVLYTGIIAGVLNLFIYQRFTLEWHYVARMMLASVLFLAIQYALKTQQSISRLLLEKEQIQTENYRVQLKALRAQIDPHFLFNSLNTLRSMVRQQHSNSEQFIISLSDFYRQTLNHNEDTTLQLSKELDVLQSYLFLMKSRNEEAVSIDINIDPSLNQFLLPALALQGVVENCFKHNSMTSKKPLHIEITNTDDHYIVVRNNIQPKIGAPNSSGYGLDILRKRYELMNVSQGVIVEKTPDRFTAKLKLM